MSSPERRIESEEDGTGEEGTWKAVNVRTRQPPSTNGVDETGAATPVRAFAIAATADAAILHSRQKRKQRRCTIRNTKFIAPLKMNR